MEHCHVPSGVVIRSFNLATIDATLGSTTPGPDSDRDRPMLGDASEEITANTSARAAWGSKVILCSIGVLRAIDSGSLRIAVR